MQRVLFEQEGLNLKENITLASGLMVGSKRGDYLYAETPGPDTDHSIYNN
jgi:hypothetical protein